MLSLAFATIAKLASPCGTEGMVKTAQALISAFDRADVVALEMITGGDNAHEGIKSTEEISKSEEFRFHGGAACQGTRGLILRLAQSF